MTEGERTEAERERARLERERRRTSRNGQTPLPDPPPVVRPPAAPPAWRGAAEQRFDAPPPAASSPAPAAPPAPPAGGGMSTARKAAIAAGALAGLLVVWFLISLFQPFAGAGKGEGRVDVTIPKGASVGQIGDLLAAKDVVGSATKFGWRASWSGKSGDFKAGRYVFGRGMSYGAAIDLLAAGPNAGTTTVTIPEGRSRYEIAQQVSALGLRGDYMAASVSSPLLNPRRYGAPANVQSLEGFLFPATYQLPAASNVAKLVPQQLNAFKLNIANVNMRYARSKNLTVFDVLTIASLVEREVQKPAERKLVAAVIYNRLKRGMPLGIDATTRFETRNWTQPLTNAVLQKDTPYNSRLNKGLPPGPIGNPGLASIKAAAHPAKVGYLYYVANPCKPGAHSFSTTYAQFQADVQRYNAARAKAGGRQPTGC